MTARTGYPRGDGHGGAFDLLSLRCAAVTTGTAGSPGSRGPAVPTTFREMT